MLRKKVLGTGTIRCLGFFAVSFPLMFVTLAVVLYVDCTSNCHIDSTSSGTSNDPSDLQVGGTRGLGISTIWR